MTKPQDLSDRDAAEASGAGSESSDHDTETGIDADVLGSAVPETTTNGKRTPRGEPGSKAPAGSVMDNSYPVND